MFFFRFNPYVAIIGDIKGSRKIQGRAIVQEELKQALAGINEKYSNDIASKFTVTLGDEFQGLLCSGANAMSIVLDIERRMDPIRVRFGIGVGEISTNIDRELAIGADGSAYYKAREAIEYLKRKEKRNKSGEADVRLEVDGTEHATVELINTILSLMTAIKNSWTDRQRQAIWNMLEHQDSQSDVAQRLGITQSSVQKNLTKGSYYTYTEAVNTVEKVMSEIRREDV